MVKNEGAAAAVVLNGSVDGKGTIRPCDTALRVGCVSRLEKVSETKGDVAVPLRYSLSLRPA